MECAKRACWPKRGRPKQEKLKIDWGTPELQRHRLQKVAGHRDKVRYSVSWLGILYAEGHLSEKYVRIGEYYMKDAYQALRCLQSPTLKRSREPSKFLNRHSCDLSRLEGMREGPWSDAYEQAVLHRWRLLTHVLKEEGSDVKGVVDRVLVYDQPIPVNSFPFCLFEKGLGRLAKFYEGRLIKEAD